MLLIKEIIPALATTVFYLEVWGSTKNLTGPEIYGTSKVPTSGGEVQINGSNFGDDLAKVIPKINDITCSSYRFGEVYTQLICNVGHGVGANLTVEVDVDGQEANSLFSYEGMVLFFFDDCSFLLLFSTYNFHSCASKH